LLLLITLGAFANRSFELVSYLRLGQGKDDRKPHSWGQKFKDMIVVYFGQRKLLQWTIPGLMHFFIFWGFLVLFTTIVEAFGSVFQAGFHIPLLGQRGARGAVS